MTSNPSTHGSRIRRAVFVPRFGGDPSADWYRWLIRKLGDLGVESTFVPLLPEPTAPAIDQTVAAIVDAVGDDREHTVLIGHSVGSRALLAYLDRYPGRPFAGLISVAGWFTIDQVEQFPPLVPWAELDLDHAAVAAAAGPITVHLSDDDPFTADWAATAEDWRDKLSASVRLTRGAGHFMTTTAEPVLDTVRAALVDQTAQR